MTPLSKKTVLALLRRVGVRRRAHIDWRPSTHIRNGARRSAVTQREARFSDFAAVAKLRECCGWPHLSPEFWQRTWRDNPALALCNSPPGMGWVLEDEGDTVGYHGNIPLIYRYGDRQLLAATGTGMVVEPGYRLYSISLAAPFYNQKGVDLCLVTTASESHGRIAQLLRAEPLPQRDCGTVLFWILDSHGFAKALAAGFDADGAAARQTLQFATLLKAVSVWTERTVHRRGPPSIRHKFRITEIPVEQIGDAFEALWRRKLAERDRLLADRSPASLRWHYSELEPYRKTTVLCCWMQGWLAGYAVVQSIVDGAGLHRCVLSDLLVERDDPEITENLLAAAYARARACGGHVFEVSSFPRGVRDILLRWRPNLRFQPCPFFYKTADRTLHALLADEANWYPTPFDGDATLMP
jgi:hypothetical protein